MACLTLALLLLWHPGVRAQNGLPAIDISEEPGGSAQILTAKDVRAVIMAAAEALNDKTL
ncbi:MAG: hypothetical protein OSB03_04865 [Vicinamibacterales bacterium]|nr:hypothetical protein [Vicinamibacterales bacterium]